MASRLKLPLILLLCSVSLFSSTGYAQMTPCAEGGPGDIASKADAEQEYPLLKNLLNGVLLLGGLAGGAWALILFQKERRVKTIDTLISLEQEFRRHADFLLKIETAYASEIKPVLVREAANDSNAKDERTLRRLDGMLRHFFVCLQARNLGVISEKVADDMYGYYLKMLMNEFENENRKELAGYVDRYWPSIVRWAARISPS
jgi:hypothetical protein